MLFDFQKLKNFILDLNILTDQQVIEAEEKALKEKLTFEEILIKYKYLSQSELIKLKSYILGIPFIDLEKFYAIPHILRIIPEAIARKYNIIAFRQNDNNLEVAMLDPENIQIIDFIKKKTNLNIVPRLTNEVSIRNLLKQYQKTIKAEFEEMFPSDLSSEWKARSFSIKRDIESDMPAKEDLEKMAEDIPIVKIVDVLIKHAILQNASDIHIEPTDKELIVRYRVDGILRNEMILPIKVSSGIIARIKILSNLKLDEHRLPQDGRFKIETSEYKISFRVSIMPVYGGEKIVMRLLREEEKSMTFEELGFNSRSLSIIKRSLTKTIGMILITGPTGSGKTTTLYTMLSALNTNDVNICTVEDPIEYRIPHINQTQVNPKIGLSFANGLRALLRQDPNVVMVGEIRDNETASLAINAALTGHIVLSTLHTNNAAGALPRLIDMGIESFLISSTLNVVIAQRLVRKFGEEAREKYFLSEDEIKNLTQEFNMNKILQVLKKEKIIKETDSWNNIQFFKPKSTKECPSGYKGRIGIYEVFELSKEIKKLINNKVNFEDIEDQAIKEGMITMIEDGFIKAAQGITSIEEVLRAMRE